MGLSDGSVEAAIAVSDLSRAEQFYEGQLGLRPGDQDDQPDKQWVRYPCREGTTIFVFLSPDHAGHTDATLAGFFVDDLDETMHELASRGVLFEQYDLPGIKTDDLGVFDSGRFRAVWVKDPDGNTLAISQNY